MRGMLWAACLCVWGCCGQAVADAQAIVESRPQKAFIHTSDGACLEEQLNLRDTREVWVRLPGKTRIYSVELMQGQTPVDEVVLKRVTKTVPSRYDSGGTTEVTA